MRIVILMNGESPLHRNQVREVLSRVPGVGWWNQFTSVFLVSDPNNNDVAWWRNLIAHSINGPSVLILAANDGWAAFAPDDAMQWMTDNW